MSEDTFEKLEREARVAQELLYLVLEHVGEPVEVPGDRIKAGISKDRMIDLQLDQSRDMWVLTIKEIADAEV